MLTRIYKISNTINTLVFVLGIYFNNYRWYLLVGKNKNRKG